MVFMLVNGYSYWAIAKDLGVARTTVMRMKSGALQRLRGCTRPDERPPDYFAADVGRARTDHDGRSKGT
jgi:DNA-directed RNA polymerase specialized sigma24 family protein